MNFLQIAKKVDELAQTQGIISTVNPTNGFQTGIVERIKQVNHDLHMYRKDWLFNYTEVDIPISTTVDTYSNTDIRKWESVVYDNQYLRAINYSTYLREDWSSESKPYKFTIKPDNSLIFNGVDAPYIVKGTGYLKPDTLENDTDIPRIPEEYHYLIVYGSLISLGSSLSLGNISSEYTIAYNIMLGNMMRDQVPSRSITMRPLV